MHMQKKAKWFGYIFIVIGILGFVPGITSNGQLLGIFEVGAVHNIVHVLSGIIALMCAGSMGGAKSFFKIFGVIYGLVAILGLLGSGSVLGIFMVNRADNLLHLVIAVIALWLGFFGGSSKMSAPMQQGQM